MQATPAFVKVMLTFSHAMPTFVHATPTFVHALPTFEMPTLVHATPTFKHATPTFIHATPTFAQAAPTLIHSGNVNENSICLVHYILFCRGANSTTVSRFSNTTHDSMVTVQTNSMFEPSGQNPLTALTREYSEILANKIRATQTRVS